MGPRRDFGGRRCRAAREGHAGRTMVMVHCLTERSLPALPVLRFGTKLRLSDGASRARSCRRAAHKVVQRLSSAPNMTSRSVMALILVVGSVTALENGLARLPPLGWRSWNAFGGSVTQGKMEHVMDALVDTSRGESLKALGYTFVGLDDGWQECGAGVNGSFHNEHGEPLINQKAFPSLGQMVHKAHALGLKAGWYLNNCICNEHSFHGQMADLVQRRDVAALRRFGFDGLKIDSCSQWNNLTRWNELINASGPKPVLIENCHQGGLDPGAQAWQTFLKLHNGSFEHKLGYLAAGHDLPLSPATNVTFATCEAACVGSSACIGFSFEGADVHPRGSIEKCFLKVAGAGFVPYDASNARCDFDGSPNDCPYNFYRTSGDINAHWASMLANLATVVPFLEKNASRPGAFAYPDMLVSTTPPNPRPSPGHSCALPLATHTQACHRVFASLRPLCLTLVRSL